VRAAFMQPEIDKYPEAVKISGPKLD